MRFAVFIGLVGGAWDLGVGLSIILTASTSAPGESMSRAATYAGGILLIFLGGAVLATAIYAASRSMVANRRFLGLLMLAYGATMLFVSAAMFAGWFPMMTGSEVSGAAMVVLGLAMLSSGATMRKTRMPGP